MCQFAVVGKEQESGGVVIEPADGENMRTIDEEIGDAAPPVGVAHRRHHAERFIEDQVGRLRRKLEPHSANLDPIASSHERPECAHGRPIYPHGPTGDHLVGASPRRHPRTRQILIKPNPVPRHFLKAEILVRVRFG